MRAPLPVFFERVLDLPPRGEALFVEALTHDSVLDRPSNERLEFLGDAVLKLVVAEWLYERFPGYDEGAMTKVHGHLVASATLAQVARRMHLGDWIEVASAADRAGVRTKPAVIAAAFEAVLAAVYQTYGYPTAVLFVRRHLDEALAAAAAAPGAENAKSQLQELTQARGLGLPDYRVVGGEGPQHQYVFLVEVEVAGRTLGKGQGPSKRAAEQLAAAEALGLLQGEPPA